MRFSVLWFPSLLRRPAPARRSRPRGGLAAVLRLWAVLTLLLAPGGGAAPLLRHSAARLAAGLPVVGARPAAAVGALGAGLLAAVAVPPARTEAAAVGTPWGWGSDGWTQLDDGSTTNKTNPVQSLHMSEVVQVAGGYDYTLYLTADGSVWAVGYNGYGQLGDGTTTGRSTPVQVKGLGGVGYLTDVKAIASHYTVSLALKNDGTVWAWGEGDKGELGNGASVNSSTPVQVSGLGGVTAIAAGWWHGLALRSDGSVWAWGWNVYGQLGDGTTTTRNAPVQVKDVGGTGNIGAVTAIAAGSTHSLALKGDGSVWAWGRNAEGELGNGSSLPSWKTSPVQAGNGIGGVVGIAGGYEHVVALKNDGTVWAWGNNRVGQLGDGTTTQRLSPVQVLGLSGAVGVASGNEHVLAVKNDGTVWAWGNNLHGELADGTTTDRWTPVRSGGLTGVTGISAGIYHSLAFGPAVEAPPAGTPSTHVSYQRDPGDPVNSYTGAYGYTRTDLALPGPGPSPALVRSYSSADTRVGPLGPGWTHTYNARLTTPGDGSGALILVTPEGRSDRYTPNADGTYTPPPSITTRLARNADGTYTATHADQGRWVFSGAGRLTWVIDRYGLGARLTYDATGRLAAVADPAGRGSLTLAYDPTSGRLTSVTDWQTPTPRVVRYEYDAYGRLWKVTDRAGQTTTYGYEGTGHRLTTITDARGNVALTNHYDAQGRVDWQKDARGLLTGQQTTFAYVANGDGTQTTTVTYPATSHEPAWTPRTTD
ncbi:MAG TPA: DUF6531 domain-containing protein, partial [Chloroflexota bacterium]|nr:DUF6531 domain-containing protein [Chloroflexota bacterium]